jgi:hypothetical protein
VTDGCCASTTPDGQQLIVSRTAPDGGARNAEPDTGSLASPVSPTRQPATSNATPDVRPAGYYDLWLNGADASELP